MRVVILSHEYPPYTFGGVAYYTMELAEYLASKGFTIYVITGRSNKQHVDIENRDGIGIIRVKFLDFPIRSIWYSVASKNIIQKLADNADYVIFNSGSIGLLPMWLHKRNNKFISIIHSTIFSLISYFKYIKFGDKLRYTNSYEALYYTSFLLINRKLNKKELEISNNVISVARHIVDELTQIYPELSDEIRTKSYIVYGGVNYEYLSSIYELYKKPARNHERVIYAYVGRLYLAKGAHYALEAFKLIQDELDRETELWIFGKGPLERQMIIYAKKNSLNVRFLGFVSREKLMRLLAKHVSVLLFPSLYEGCPYTLLEANTLGIPVVTWDMPWSREFVAQGVNGYCAKLFSLEELADYSIKALFLPSRKIHEYAQKYNKKNTFSKLDLLLIRDSAVKEC